jgi:hypothetical protein
MHTHAHTHTRARVHRFERRECHAVAAFHRPSFGDRGHVRTCAVPLVVPKLVKKKHGCLLAFMTHMSVCASALYALYSIEQSMCSNEG